MARGVAGPDTSVGEVGGPTDAVGAKRLHGSGDLGIIVTVTVDGVEILLRRVSRGIRGVGRGHSVVPARLQHFLHHFLVVLTVRTTERAVR